jgi:Mg-chelatase subunit ChlD
LLQPISFKQEEKIRRVIGNLKSSGKTDVDAGLKLAYQVADKNYIRGGNNRIVLATDGEFPVNEESMKLIEHFASEDIFISIFNFGKGSASARTLEKLATMGRGNYEHITAENAEFKLIREAKSKRKK